MADVLEIRPGRHLGPQDEGALLELAEFEGADFEEGYRYDLVDGRLEVSPEPDFPHDEPLDALDALLREYRDQHRGAFGYITFRGRVYPTGGRSTVGPDLALFREHRPPGGRKWSELSALLVVEVLSPGQARKDLERNRIQYAKVPSIREYWIVDPRRGRSQLTLRVLRRRETGDWDEQLVQPDERYECALFPGLIVDLSRADLGLEPLAQLRRERTMQEGELNLLTRLLRERLVGRPELEALIDRLRRADPETLRRAASLVLQVDQAGLLIDALDRLLPGTT